MREMARVVATALLFTASAVHAQQYSAVDLGTLGGKFSYGAAINASGQITGYSANASGAWHAFVTNASTDAMSDLGALGGSANQSFGNGINARGQVVGWSDIDSGSQAFVRNPSSAAMSGLGPSNFQSAGYAINDHGQVAGLSYNSGGSAHAVVINSSTNAITDLGTLVGPSGGSVGTGINNAGFVTGWSDAGGGNEHAFLADSKTRSLLDLGTLEGGDGSSYGNGINARGQVTGYSSVTPYTFHAFVTVGKSDTLRDIGTLGGSFSAGYGINDHGEVTGTAARSNGLDVGFLYANGKMIDLNSLLSASQQAQFTIQSGQGINDRGQIVADGIVDATGQRVAFLLNPTGIPAVPNPPSAWMMMLGLGVFAAVFAKRQGVAFPSPRQLS